VRVVSFALFDVAQDRIDDHRGFEQTALDNRR